MIKPGRMWARHVVRMAEMGTAYKFRSNNLNIWDRLEKPGEVRIILKWMLKKEGGKLCTGFSSSEPSSSIKDYEFP
jgi:hypothetical protein